MDYDLKPIPRPNSQPDPSAPLPDSVTLPADINAAQSVSPTIDTPAVSAPPIDQSVPPIPTNQPTVFGPGYADISQGTAQNMQAAVFQATPDAVMGGSMPRRRFRPSKRLVIVVAVLLILMGGSAAAYVGIIVPNKPASMWHKSLLNTGLGFDKLLDYNQTLQQSSKGASVKGDYSLSGGVTSTGTISASSYGQNGSLTTSFTVDGKQVSVDLRSLLTSGAKTPDIYFRLGGLDALNSVLGDNAGTYQSIINSLNNQWIVISHSYTESLLGNNSPQVKISAQDIIDTERDLNEINKQWLWTDQPDHNVLVVAKDIGKEKLDNRSVYHYQVHLDKDHTVQYLEALRDKYKTTKLHTDLNGTIFANVDVSDADIEQAVTDKLAAKTFDVWVDTRTKLPHAVKFAGSDGYVTLGQDYQGGTSFPFSLTEHDTTDGQTNDLSATMTVDTKTNQVTIAVTDTEGKNKFVLHLTISQNTQPASIQAPTGAKSIADLLSQLGVQNPSDPSTSFISTDPSAKTSQDVERQTDINALQAQIEAYYAQYGYYPTLANLNDSNWRSTNLRGLDDTALKDPQGTSETLVASPTAHAYAYAVTDISGGVCDNNSDSNSCQQYTLSATLSDGSHYDKTSLFN